MSGRCKPPNGMNGSWLVLETSGRVAKLGLVRGGAVARAVHLDDTRRHARDIAPQVAAMLAEESLTPADLTGIMAGRGPGSYTGLRVGLTSAKALAYATGCKLVAVDTFAAIAEQSPLDATRIWLIADALQGQVYCQRFERTPEGVRAVDALAIVNVDDWLPFSGGTHVTGPGVNVYGARLPADCVVVAEADRDPRIESVFAVGSRLAPLSREELFALEPLYLRGSSAEEKAKKG